MFSCQEDEGKKMGCFLAKEVKVIGELRRDVFLRITDEMSIRRAVCERKLTP